MKDLWLALEERTRTWDALRRQGLADAVWEVFVSTRFRRTGDPRALEYLYPYLNHADRETRGNAIAVAARVFEGRGPGALDRLAYFTQNSDLFLRDRAVLVVGAAVTGCRDDVILSEMAPYLNSPNRFVRKLALAALGRAAAGQASEGVLAEILRVAETLGPCREEVRTAVASVFAGKPSEETWPLVASEQPIEEFDRDNAWATAGLVCGASQDWYLRACKEVFEPRLSAAEATGWRRGFIQRNGVTALCRAGIGKGMEPLGRMLPLRGERTAGYALLNCSPRCLIGAEYDENRDALLELAKAMDIPSQRIAALCLGRMVMGKEDERAIECLRELCDAKSRALQTSALTGLGMAALSRCDDRLRKLCVARFGEEETAPAAIRALGQVFLGSGSREVYDAIRERAIALREEPVRTQRHSKPLAACYHAVGLLYLGTGSDEPVEFLLDVLSRPPKRMDEYRKRAARSLAMVEFPEAAQRWDNVLPDWWKSDVTPLWNVPY